MRTVLRQLIGQLRNWRDGSDVDYREVALTARLARGVTIKARTRVDQRTIIGGQTYVGFNCFITAATIGRYVSVANNVSVGPGEHDFAMISTSSALEKQGYDDLTSNPCVIGNDVWIGVDSVIRRGVTVGDGAVIGANSFVHRDVPPFAIVAGSPARLLRFRFSEDIRRRIVESQWWTLDPPDALRVVRSLERELLRSAERLEEPASKGVE